MIAFFRLELLHWAQARAEDMASSSLSHEGVNGTVILVNMYLSKTDPAYGYELHGPIKRIIRKSRLTVVQKLAT